MIKASVNKKPAPIENDTKGGSIGYNRLDMQVSQALHMAIELYPNLNYLLIMDHYDDITLFDDEAMPKVVSYYQMKTSEETISIDTAISEKWLLNYEGVDKRNAALEYTTMVEDFERKSDLFTALFLEVHGLCLGNPQSAGESPLNYSKRIFNLLSTRSLIYNETYQYLSVKW